MISEDFDENFYLDKYPITKDYYNTSNLSLRERLFHHYINFGQKSGYCKNEAEYRDRILGPNFQVDEDFDENFYAENFPQTINYLCNNLDFSLRDRLFHHYINYGKKLNFSKNPDELVIIAKKLFLEGKFYLAKKMYEKIYDHNTKDVEIIVNYADCLDDEDLKIGLYKKALRIKENPFAYLGAAKFYIVKRDFNSAQEQIDKLKNLNLEGFEEEIEFINSRMQLFENLIDYDRPYHRFLSDINDLSAIYRKSLNENSDDSWVYKKLLSLVTKNQIIFDNEIELIIKNKNEYDKKTQSFIEKIVLNKLASLVVCCTNKEENLIKILPSWINIDQIREIIIVDYSSENPLSQNKDLLSIKSNKIKIIRVDGENIFNLGKAYNLAVDFCNYDTIIKIDCDYECKNSKWIDLVFNHPEKENIFIHGDWKFNKSLTGFFVINKSKFEYFREDLNGYGRDEMDLYIRIKEKHPEIIEINWFDIESSIRHLDHDDDTRTKNYLIKDKKKSLAINTKLCEFSEKIIRNNYHLENNAIVYDKQKISKILCINLEQNKDRWEKIKSIPGAERFDAVKINNNLEEFNFNLSPVDGSSYIYFKINPNGLGCYVSHYLIWEKIVDEEIPYSLILEDDVDVESVDNFLNSNIIINDLDVIQLSKRIRKKKNRIIFDGGESYVLSLEGAKKLINFTNNPWLLHNIKPAKLKNVKSICDKGLYDDKPNWSKSRAITCPVDKFIGYCSQKKIPEKLRLNSYIYPIINLDEETSSISNIDNVHELWAIPEQKLIDMLLKYKYENSTNNRS